MTENTETSIRSGEENFLKVTRSRRNVVWSGAGALVVIVALFLFPYYVGPGTTGIMVQGLIVLTLASMWNLLAGYAGLVSVGQQGFLGLGAYFVLIPAMHGVTPWAGLFIAAIGAAVCAVPLWWLVARLRTGYFAIATWVLASVIMLVIEQISSVGGGTGESLPGLSGMDAAVLTAYTYWAARSSGVRVGLARMGVFIAAAAGCGAAGGVLAIEQLQVVPGTSGGVFSVQWTAEMAFAVIIGGIGTIEGPILGTIVYMVLQQTLQSYNAWYLIILGLVAVVVAIFARRGLWGTLDKRFNIRLFPVGYHLWSRGENRRRKRPAGQAAP
jgi:branched-chain amino acid transport system permease protein